MVFSSRVAGCCWLHWLSVAMLVAGTVAASSCAQTPVGEFTAAACSDNEDNDGDGVRDCDDPDCWVFCPHRGNFEIGDASFSTPPDASFGTTTSPVADSGKPNSMSDDAGTAPIDPSSEDAGGMPSKCGCARDESCVAGECQPAASASIAGMYTLSVKSAYVPLGPSETSCFDYNGVGCLGRTLVICECQVPDPYVVVLLNDDVLMMATTPVVHDTANPVWSPGPVVTIDLKPEDKLTFIAFDSDAIQDQEIFSCMPALSPLGSGTDTLSCGPQPGTTLMPPAGTNYIITAEVRKIVPDAAMP